MIYLFVLNDVKDKYFVNKTQINTEPTCNGQ